MGMFENMKSLVGLPYDDLYYNKDLMDTVFLRAAKKRGVRLPSVRESDRDRYYGAHVFDSRAGLHENVGYLDYSSMYPTLMITLNASLDTIIGTQADLEDSQWTEDECVWGYIDTRPIKEVTAGENWRQYSDGQFKMIYDPEKSSMKWSDEPQLERCYFIDPATKEGFMTETVQEWIDNKYDGNFNHMYAEVKSICNSTYGFTGDSRNSRLFDWRIAESVTLAGRLVIQKAAEVAVNRLQEEYDEEIYVALGDTDGFGLCMSNGLSRRETLERLYTLAEYMNTTMLDEYMASKFGADEHCMEIEVESYSPRVFVPRDIGSDDPQKGIQKRYAKMVSWED